MFSPARIALNMTGVQTLSVHPEPVEGLNESYIACQPRSWFDKLTTHVFPFWNGYNKKEYALSRLLDFQV